MKFSLALVGALAGLAMVSTAHAATVFSAVGDFSTTSNPHGAWAYGDGSIGSFTPLTVTGTQTSGGTYNYWQDANPASQVPWIGTTSTVSPFSEGSIFYPQGYLVMHPGEDVSNNAIVQWTASTAGAYSLSGSFSLLDTTPNGVIGEVFDNGKMIYSGVLSGFGANQGAQTVGASESFGGRYVLNAGDTLSFVVNNDGSYFNDSTGLIATITAVPEPASWALMILGVGGMGMALRAKRKSATVDATA